MTTPNILLLHSTQVFTKMPDTYFVDSNLFVVLETKVHNTGICLSDICGASQGTNLVFLFLHFTV